MTADNWLALFCLKREIFLSCTVCHFFYVSVVVLLFLRSAHQHDKCGVVACSFFSDCGEGESSKIYLRTKNIYGSLGWCFFFSSPSLSNIDKQPLNVIFLQTAFYFRLFKLSTQSRQRVNLSIKPRIYTAPFGNTMKTLPTFYNCFFHYNYFSITTQMLFHFYLQFRRDEIF